jgi:phosphoribosylformylglycinamidine synthase subunit PurS
LTTYEARIEVGHRPGILDPQGGVIERALPALGWANVSQVRVGKSIRLAVDAPDEDSARVQVEEMCRRLLANPVIEDFTVTISSKNAPESPNL